MLEKINNLKSQIEALTATSADEVEALRIKYLSKKGEVSALFNDFADDYSKNLAKKLNLRPRKKLSFSNPKTEFFKQIANFALAS